jgi:hypothetical protein
VVAGGENGGVIRAGDAGADRQAPAEPLGQGHHVRPHGRVLPRPHRAGAAHAALHLVEDQQRPGAVAGLARGGQHLVAQRVNPALALHRLEQHRRGGVADRGVERGRIVARHHREAGHERRERRLLGLLRGGRQRAVGAPVEGVLDHHHPAAPVVLAGQLDRALVGLRARVAEEHAAAERPLREPLGEPYPGLGVVEVRRVDQAAGLLAQRGHESGVAVADLVHGYAGHEVEVLVALVVPQPRALAAHELHRQAGVGLHHGFALERLKLG